VSAITLASLAVALAAAQSAPELPERHRQWLEEEVPYIIVDRERAAFLELQSAEERDAFIEAFWRRRDPDPLTEANEFREEHYRRIEHANRMLGRETPIPGWMTDRGKMYIILGEPRDRESFLGAPGLYPAEVWFYEAQPNKGISSPFYLLFFQQGFAGEFRLYSPRIHGPEKLFPALQFGENSRMEAYRLLQNISADLAHASITFRADEGAIPGILTGTGVDAISTDVLLAEVYRSPTRAVDASYVDAIARNRGLVETDYLFNYVPNHTSADVLPGPPGLEDASFVHWGIEIEPQHLTLVFDEDKKVYYTSFEIQGEVTTAAESLPVLSFSREEFVQLTPSQLEGVQARPFAFRSMFPILPGEFRLRVVLKNRARNQYTILESPLSVPVRAPGEVSLRTPLLLYGSEKAEASQYRPYQIGSERLDPNTKRVYALGRPLLAYLPVTGAGREDRLAMTVVNRETSEPVGETIRFAVGDRRLEPVIESIPLAVAAGGRYRLEVALEDRDGEVLGKSSADFDVSPRSAIDPPWSLRWSSLDPTVPGVVETALAEQYLRLDDRAYARALYERALKKNENLAAPRLVLGRYLLDEGNPAKAAEIVAPLAETRPEDVEVRRTLGDAYYQSGSPALAIPHFEKALELAGPDVPLLNALGACYAAAGEAARAIQILEQSLQRSPDQKSVQELLTKLKTPSDPNR
jgi:GWxTD domain-containing protein